MKALRAGLNSSLCHRRPPSLSFLTSILHVSLGSLFYPIYLLLEAYFLTGLFILLYYWLRLR